MTEKIKTGIRGFDGLLGKGIEKGSVVLVAGGTGTGKTNFCCQCMHHGAVNGENVLYVSFEEPIEQIKQHMGEFGMDFDELERRGAARFLKIDVYYIARALEALFNKKLTGDLLIKEGLPKIIPDGFRPDRMVIDSLAALETVLKAEEYRYFIFQLFSHLKRLGATTFAVSETKQEPDEYSRSGVEEFLADSVIALHHVKRGDVRARAVEILKLRGTKHEERLVPFKITDDGIVVYPEQELFS